MRQNIADGSAANTLELDRELQEHLAALGLVSVQAYQGWCTDNGFSSRLSKHWRDRCKERYFAARSTIQAHLARKKREKRSASKVLEELFEPGVEPSELHDPTLERISQLNATIEDDGVKAAFRRILLSVQSKSNLLENRPALSRLGSQTGNTFVEGLFSLAHHYLDWLRPVESWVPHSCNVQRQFVSLAEHLLTRYSPPPFFISVWFRGQSVDVRKQQDWYKAIGSGQSPRDLILPLPLTRQMARHFLSAPKEYLIEEALRWGQVRGMGGSRQLVQSLLGSRIGTNFENHSFWIATIHWLIRHPSFDHVQIGPLIDYIHQTQLGNASLETNAALQEREFEKPTFQIQGQTPASLLQRIHRWHGELRQQNNQPNLGWFSSGIGSFEFSEGVLTSGTSRIWTIIELLSRKELFLEGQTLRHCVARYDQACAHGGSSIWSLGVAKNNGCRKRVLTIEVTNRTKVICQVRGKANRFASQKEMEIIGRWARQEQLTVAGQAG